MNRKPSPTRPTIWIDLENTPHVPFFLPIIRDLEAAGCRVVLTARDFAQTRELAAKAGMNPKVIGRAYGNATIPKVFGILWRTLRLAAYIRGQRATLAVGHGSRGLLLAAKLLRIPALTLYDYEGASVSLFNRLSTWVMTPEVIPLGTLTALGLAPSKHLTYPGLKEEVYTSEFKPTVDIATLLALDPNKLLVTLRPPSQSAHYRSQESFRLFDEIMHLLVQRADVQIVILPRTPEQRADLTSKWAEFKAVRIPTEAIPGLDLLAASNLVIGGGGTVNREAAALGIPIVSIFKGQEGEVDKWLVSEGRMVVATLGTDILPFLQPRASRTDREHASPRARKVIVETILRLAHSS